MFVFFRDFTGKTGKYVWLRFFNIGEKSTAKPNRKIMQKRKRKIVQKSKENVAQKLFLPAPKLLRFKLSRFIQGFTRFEEKRDHICAVPLRTLRNEINPLRDL